MAAVNASHRFAPGGGWSTWNVPPWVEPTPTVVYYTGTTGLTMTFSGAVSIFGFEAEPNPYEVHNMTALFKYQGSPVGSISMPVDGSGGARLFAARGTLFDEVVFSSDTDFSVARVRYGYDPNMNPVPEAGTLVSLGSMLGAGLLWLRRRFQS